MKQEPTEMSRERHGRNPRRSRQGGRQYYGWLGEPIATEPTDGDIKARIVAQLRKNPHTADADIKVDVKQRVVILGGVVATPLAKRVAGDDAWDTEGVVDVSNQLQIGEIAR